MLLHVPPDWPYPLPHRCGAAAYRVPDLVLAGPRGDRRGDLLPRGDDGLGRRRHRAPAQPGDHAGHAARPDRGQAPRRGGARLAARDRQARGLDRGRDRRPRACRHGAPRRRGVGRRHRASLAPRQVEDREPVRRDHDADRREGLRPARVPRGRGARPVGRARAHGDRRGRLLLPLLPEGGLPGDRSGRRTLVVNGALALAAAYLVGALPVGFLVARVFGVGDLRRYGSGNIGATNVLRAAGWVPALLTLVGDVAKGYLAVAAAGALAGDAGARAAAAVAAIIGNCWSVFLGFRGGKGVATGLGALLNLVPWAVAPAIPVWLAVAVTTRYVSLGSILGAACVPLGALLLGYGAPAMLAALAGAAIIIARHHDNIGRLLAGTERRLGRGRSAA